jgi:hypothetical protein
MMVLNKYEFFALLLPDMTRLNWYVCNVQSVSQRIAHMTLWNSYALIVPSKELNMLINHLRYMWIVIVLVAVACRPQAMQSLPTAMPTVTPAPILTSTPAPWLLVAVGDSIPFSECFGCKGFVDRYAMAVTEATGHAVKVQNLAEHNGLQIDGLLQELKTDTTRREALANADIIVVGIAANDIAMNSNVDLCDGPNPDIPDWSKYNADCAVASAELFRPKFESVFSQIVALRGGKPTIFRTINRYNDWIGWPGHDLPPEGIEATRLVLDAWNEMVCRAAEENGFVCADIYHEFNGPDGLTPSAGLVAADYTHPSFKGNQAIASVLTDLGFAPLAAP